MGATDPFLGLRDVPGVSHRYVTANGVGLHVAEAGAGDPVMLLHGWPQHWWMWRNVMPALAERYRVIAPDLRGFGWSDAPAPRRGRPCYDKRELATDILALIDQIGIDRPIKLAGHDWGGWIGFLIAMREPQRFERFMPMNIPPPWGDPGRFDLRRQIKALSRLGYQLPLSTPGVNRWLLSGGGRDRFKRGIVHATDNRDAWSDGSLDHFLGQFEDARRADASMYLYRTFLTRELRPIVTGKYVRGRLTVPTRMLFGADDVVVTREVIEADHSRMADDFSVEIVEGCGHFIVDEQPDLVTAGIIEWFGAGAAGPRGPDERSGATSRGPV
ncbi:MAG: alpha/beta hydrolase [Solirubrobacterales bacterium]